MQPLASADLLELKKRLLKLIGPQKGARYFHLLGRLISNKISKPQFNRMCLLTIGKENIGFHNLLIRGIIGNAVRSAQKKSMVTVTGQSGTDTLQENHPGMVPVPASRGVRSVRSPLGKPPRGHEKEVNDSSGLKSLTGMRGLPDLRSLGSKAPFEVISVEDGEEVVSGSPCVQSRSPIPAPLGILKAGVANRLQAAIPTLKVPSALSSLDDGELPETSSVFKDMGQRLEAEGLSVSMECATVMNCAVDMFLKRLIKPALDLSRARSTNNQSYHPNVQGMVRMDSRLKSSHASSSGRLHIASLQDCLVAFESNPRLLSANWSLTLEKIRKYMVE